jgi:MFS family permease
MSAIFYGWWIVLASFIIALYIGGVLFYGFTAFFEPIVKELGWSYTQVSIAFSLRGLEMGILAPITGLLVDRFGSRNLILSGTLVVGLALILLSLTHSILTFYGAFVLLALGTSGCASTVLMAGVGHWFKRNVGKAMGLVVCGYGAGGLLIPVIVWLLGLYHWRTVLIILGLGMWALGIPLSFVIRHRPEQYGYLPDGDLPSEPGSGNVIGPMEREVEFWEGLKSRNFWRIAIAEAIRIMIAMAVITHVMPYLSSVGVSRTRAAFIATSIPLVSVIGRFGFGWLGDIFDKRYALACVYALLSVGTLAFSYIQFERLVLPFLAIFSLALGGSVSLRGAIVREYFGRAAFGRLFGILMGMAAMGGVVGPAIAGWTFDRFGSYHPIWVSFAGVSVIAVLLAIQLRAPVEIRGD